LVLCLLVFSEADAYPHLASLNQSKNKQEVREYKNLSTRQDKLKPKEDLGDGKVKLAGATELIEKACRKAGVFIVDQTKAWFHHLNASMRIWRMWRTDLERLAGKTTKFHTVSHE